MLYCFGSLLVWIFHVWYCCNCTVHTSYYLCGQPTTNVEEELEEVKTEEMALLRRVQIANGEGGRVRERRSENGVIVEGNRILKQIQHRKAELGLCSV